MEGVSENDTKSGGGCVLRGGRREGPTPVLKLAIPSFPRRGMGPVPRTPSEPDPWGGPTMGSSPDGGGGSPIAIPRPGSETPGSGSGPPSARAPRRQDGQAPSGWTVRASGMARAPLQPEDGARGAGGAARAPHPAEPPGRCDPSRGAYRSRLLPGGAKAGEVTAGPRGTVSGQIVGKIVGKVEPGSLGSGRPASSQPLSGNGGGAGI
jgi:hypothetical protein